MTLACKDASSNFVEIITDADVDDEDRVGNSLLQIWELRLGQKLNFFQTLRPVVPLAMFLLLV